jgi:hypothetical protein
MERQLGTAAWKGQRVSRQKVQRALFTVADSLENDENSSLYTDEAGTGEESQSNEKTIPSRQKIANQDLPNYQFF